MRAVFTIALIHVLLNPLTGLRHLPSELFNAPGIFSLLPNSFWQWLMKDTMSISYTVLMCIGFLLIIFRADCPRLLRISLVVMLWIYDALLKGHASYINHAQFGFLYMATLLCLFAPTLGPSTDKTSPTPPSVQNQARFLFVCCGLVLTLPYTLLGIRRLSVGMGIFMDRTILHELARQSLTPSEYGFTMVYPLLQLPLAAAILRAGFFVITVFEALSALCLCSRRFRTFWVYTMVPFHLSTLFTMNIFFWENTLLIILLFTSALNITKPERDTLGFRIF